MKSDEQSDRTGGPLGSKGGGGGMGANNFHSLWGSLLACFLYSPFSSSQENKIDVYMLGCLKNRVRPARDSYTYLLEGMEKEKKKTVRSLLRMIGSRVKWRRCVEIYRSIKENGGGLWNGDEVFPAAWKERKKENCAGPPTRDHRAGTAVNAVREQHWHCST